MGLSFAIRKEDPHLGDCLSGAGVLCLLLLPPYPGPGSKTTVSEFGVSCPPAAAESGHGSGLELFHMLEM